MDEGREDTENIQPIAAEYGFIELPAVEGHRTFILEQLQERYIEGRDKDDVYILILHRNDIEHYIMGVYDDLREALQTRFVSNSILSGGGQFKQGNFMMVHKIAGPTIEDMIFDAKTDSVKPFDPTSVE